MESRRSQIAKWKRSPRVSGRFQGVRGEISGSLNEEAARAENQPAIMGSFVSARVFSPVRRNATSAVPSSMELRLHALFAD